MKKELCEAALPFGQPPRPPGKGSGPSFRKTDKFTFRTRNVSRMLWSKNKDEEERRDDFTYREQNVRSSSAPDRFTSRS